MQSTLRAVADAKHEEIQTVTPGDLVSDVVNKMKTRNIGAIVVLSENGGVAGIFSERDLLTRVVAERLDAGTTKVSEVMTSDPQCVNASMTVEEAMRKVTEQRIRHLPLITGDKLEGLISSGDLTAWALQARSAEITGFSTTLKKHKAVIALIGAFAILAVIGIFTS